MLDIFWTIRWAFHNRKFGLSIQLMTSGPM
jgi:hypothetical protein